MSPSRTRRPLEEMAYEQEELWQEGVLGKEDEARVAALAERIPVDVRTVLDVGCGNGLFLRHLQTGDRNWSRLVGVDRSRTALRHVTVDHFEAPIDELPFRDGEFDLVSCFEVIEHLPLPTYELSFAELGRVGAKYVFFCVPYAEDLRRSLSTCPVCHTRFNVNYHLREYGEQDMRDLPLPKPFECIDVFRVGPRMQLAPSMVAALHFAKRWLSTPEQLPDCAICPMCGYQPQKESTTKSPHLPRKASLKKRILQWAPRVSTFRWIAALYARR